MKYAIFVLVWIWDPFNGDTRQVYRYISFGQRAIRNKGECHHNHHWGGSKLVLADGPARHLPGWCRKDLMCSAVSGHRLMLTNGSS